MIEGLVSPADCFIRINTMNKYNSKLSEAENCKVNKKWNSVFNHEMTHYLQLITTPVGYEIRMIQQWLYSDILTYLSGFKKIYELSDIDIGNLYKNYESEPEHRKNLREHLLNRKRELSIFQKPFYQSNHRIFYNQCFPKDVSDKYTYLRKNKPIEIDVKKSCFFLKKTGHTIYISANSIMEYMAKLVQMLNDGHLKEPETIFNNLLDKRQFHYNLPLVFLVQEGVFENPLWRLYCDLGLLPLYHLALFINPLTITPNLVKKYNIDRVDELLPETLFLKCLFDPELMDVSFLTTKLNDQNCLFPFKEFANNILKNLNWPSLDELLVCFGENINENIELATNKTLARNNINYIKRLGVNTNVLGLLPNSDSRKKQFETFRRLCTNLWDKNEYIRNPITMCKEVPNPIFFELSDEGATFFPRDQDFWDILFEYSITIGLHIGQKILYSNELSCYNDPLGETSIINCPKINNCLSFSNKQNIEFCCYSPWRETILKILKQFNINYDFAN